MVYNSLTGLAPDYLKSMFTDRSTISNYSRRNCEVKLAVPLPPTNFLKNSFSYSGVVLWSSLPTNLRQAQTLTCFKSGCMDFLFDHNKVDQTAFMESRRFVFVLFFLLPDLISSRLIF